MKKFTKFLSVFMTAIMTLGMILPNMAFATETKPTKTSTVWVHKLLMVNKDDLNKWTENPEGYDGTQDAAWIIANAGGKEIKELKGVYFAVQNAEGQFIDAEGQALGDNLKTMTKENFAKVLGGLTTPEGLNLDTSNLPQSEPTQYKIVENIELSTYVGENGETLTGSHINTAPIELTLPLVNDNGVQAIAHLYPKNTEDKPKIDKNYATGTLNDEVDHNGTVASNGADYNNYESEKAAITRQIGSVVPYDVVTYIPADAKYKTLRWEDTMTKGLTFNKDVVLTEKNNKITFEPADYKVVQNQSGFVLTMNTSGLAKVEKAAKAGSLDLVLTYSATVNSDAVTDKEDENEIIFDYANNPREFDEPRENEVTPKEEQIKVEKSWDEGNAPAGIKVTYYLYEKGATAADDKVVAMVVKEGSDFNHTFTGLDNNKTYYVKETVSRGFSYNPAYDIKEAGTVKIKNTKDTVNPKPLVPTHPKVVTHSKKFVKTNNASTPERLAGAEFVVTNAEGDKYLTVKSGQQNINEAQAVKTAKTVLDAAIKAYNDLSAEDQKGTEAKAEITKAQAAYNEAFIAARTKYEWTTNKDDAYVLVSNANGQFEITGLDAGNYNLVETKAPEGYALNTAKVPFEVKDGSYGVGSGNIDYITTDDNKDNDDALRVENKKISIPQTGGIGTAIFIIAGIALMGGAFVAMKKQEA